MLRINLEWDANALAAPQSFRDGVQEAADILQAAIYDPITINVGVGYGEYDLNGPSYTPLPDWTSLGGITTSTPISYSALRAALASKASTATDAQAAAALPDTASLDGQPLFYLPTGLAKAFGAIDPDDAAIDGYAGFPANFTGATLVDAAVTELMHAAGMLNGGNVGDLGLLAYTSPGNNYLGDGGSAPGSAYFSVDGGVTDLANYAVGFDDTLFDNLANDPLAYPDQGATALTPLDLTEISAIGFDDTSPPTLPAPTLPAPDIAPAVSAPGTSVDVALRDVSVVENHAVSVLSMIGSVSVPSGDSIPAFAFEAEGDPGTDGYFALNGVAQPNGHYVLVLPSQLHMLSYVGGSVTGTHYLFAGAYDYANNQYRSRSLNVTVTPATAASIPQSDFDGNNSSDLLVQDADGDVASWLLNGQAVGATGLLGSPGTSWHAAGTGDFNGDGKSDILLQNDDGTVALWQMNGLAVAHAAIVADPGPSWHAVGAGDVNGDGKSDILLQNDNGAVAVWTTNGTAMTGASLVANPGPSWHAVGAGDFDGDGKADILLQDDTGAVAVWTMNGGAITSGAIVANPGAAWRAVAAADFDGDGKSDILLQNDDGTVAVWKMSGAAIQSAGIVAHPGPAWHAVTTGDYNGDGKADIALQNDDGSVAIWDMNNASLTGAALLANPGPGWQLTGQGSMHFIDATRTTGTVAATILSDDVVFSTALAGAHAIAGFDPLHDVVTLNGAAFPGYPAVLAHETSMPGGVTIDLGNGSSLTLDGVAPAALSARNFALS